MNEIYPDQRTGNHVKRNGKHVAMGIGGGITVATAISFLAYFGKGALAGGEIKKTVATNEQSIISIKKDVKTNTNNISKILAAQAAMNEKWSQQQALNKRIEKNTDKIYDVLMKMRTEINNSGGR